MKLERLRGKIKYIVICSVLLLIYFVLGIVSKALIAEMPEQLLAGRWSDDMRMAQVSIFITQDQSVKEDDIRRFSYMLEKKLTEAGVIAEEDEADAGSSGHKIIDTIGIDQMNKGDTGEEITLPQKTPLQELYSVSYCAQGQVTVSYENRIAEKIAAIGTGGDFFLFHPMEFVSGSAYTGEELNKDSVVIDEDMAWQLFGSANVVGQSVLIGGVPHYIVGVVSKENDRISKAAGLKDSYIYMSYDSLSKYGTILSGVTEQTEVSEDGVTASLGGIGCVEVVCPNPVNGLAAKICKEAMELKDEYVSVVDNTDRFTFFPLLGVIGSFGVRSMWGKAIYYPYWENIARGYEDILATILLIRILCMLVVIIICVVAIVQSYRHKKWTVRSVVKYLSDKKYDLEVEHRRKKETL